MLNVTKCCLITDYCPNDKNLKNSRKILVNSYIKYIINLIIIIVNKKKFLPVFQFLILAYNFIFPLNFSLSLLSNKFLNIISINYE